MLSTGERSFSDELLGAAGPDCVVLIEGDRQLTAAELTTLVHERAGGLGLAQRSLIVLSGTSSVEYVVAYLALLEAGHVPLLAGTHVDDLVDAWSPAATVYANEHDTEIQRHDAAPVPLHPDLALLLSTSGSTGSPKLVRLSHRNLSSNAHAIADYLALGSSDRGISTLPLHYCYGLSVLHSHLVVGAGLVMTDASVVDPCFRAALQDHAVTNVAGVPHTFEMFERAGPDMLRVPSMRFLTQAGGRLGPTGVQRWVERTHRWGVDFYVMYGQTEATARMAYLPPDMAWRRPDAIGVPIPGGELSLRPVDGAPPGVGELVYRGSNVMLGYALQHEDLAAGRTVDELCTGDLGRFHDDDGVFEIVGRRSRFVKPFGLRIDLDTVEQGLAGVLDDVAVTGDDDHLVVAAPGVDAELVRQAVSERTGLPPAHITVDGGPIPRTDAGKVDYASIAERQRPDVPDAIESEVGPSSSVAGVYATVLGRNDVTGADSFVSLGGDSLSYVECSVRLEALLGRVPPDWHLRAIDDLESIPRRRRHLSRLDTTALLRAVGICAVVATHMRIAFFPGGAHLLLAVVGYNLSRFMMPIESTRDRLRAGLRTVARTAIPTVMWVAAGMAIAGAYSVGTLLLVNNYVGPASHRDDHWHFWFIEVFVHLVVLTTVLLAIPAVRRLDRSYPYGFPLMLLLGCLLLRMEWAQLDDWYNLRYRTHGVAWFFVLGWLVHRSDTVGRRMVTTAVCVVAISGFFHNPQREWFITIGLLLLLWRSDIPFPRLLTRPVGVVAAASMWILITHFTVWPPLARALNDQVAYVCTVCFGVLVWAIDRHVRRSAATRAKWSLR